MVLSNTSEYFKVRKSLLMYSAQNKTYKNVTHSPSTFSAVHVVSAANAGENSEQVQAQNRSHGDSHCLVE